jgi:hypothetical protein
LLFFKESDMFVKEEWASVGEGAYGGVVWC